MDGITLLLILAATAATTSALPEDTQDTTMCPPQTTNDSIYFANPYNCSTYFQCSNGVAHELPCPPGLFFDPSQTSCVFPIDYDCHEIPHEIMYPIACPLGYIMANPLDCKSFMYCQGEGYVEVVYCPTGLYFNPEINVCDYPSNVNCAQPV